MKTKKNNKKTIIICLEFLNNLKLFHWNTKSYAEHMASDSLYDELTKLIDTLVESFLQIRQPIKASINLTTMNHSQFLRKMKDFKKNMIELNVSSELLSLKDDILVALDQFEYRLTLK
jgi:hypothetical protein